MRSFPALQGGRWLISTGGGESPVWTPSGRELFYLAGTAMMAVPLEVEGETLRPGVPELLLTGPFETGSPQFDVSPDGSWFVMVEADPEAKPTQIHLVLGWVEMLPRLAPALSQHCRAPSEPVPGRTVRSERVGSLYPPKVSHALRVPDSSPRSSNSFRWSEEP